MEKVQIPPKRRGDFSGEVYRMPTVYKPGWFKLEWVKDGEKRSKWIRYEKNREQIWVWTGTEWEIR